MFRAGWMALGTVGISLLAQEPPSALERILGTPVLVATRSGLEAAKAPAVVSVITAEDLQLTGARSVAEALERVPGLYGISDGLATDLSVRGISGGMRGYGRNLKVLLDGQPMAFRSDSSNFLGPELVPMEAVERIEVIRGPGSALYGADAFFGVVNIITRGVEGSGAAIAKAARPGSHWSGGAEVCLPGGDSRLGGMLAGAAQVDRLPDQAVPASSPILLSAGAPDGASRNQVDRPLSLHGRSWWQPSEGLQLDLSGSFQRLDTLADWLSFGTLSHQNRVALDQGHLRLAARETLAPGLDLTGSAAWSEGGPASTEHLNAGDPDSYPRRRYGFKAWDGSLALRWVLPGGAAFTGGLDGSQDKEWLDSIWTVDAATGIASPSSPDQGTLLFRNLGAYLQAEVPLGQAWTLTLNGRRDEPNRYAGATTCRSALLWAPGGPVSAKLLFGTSFKAPSAFDLYAQPLAPGDLLGNPGLQPERARTWEAEVRFRLAPDWALNVNAFMDKIADKVEPMPWFYNFRPENLALEKGSGLEAELVGYQGPSRFNLTAACQKTDETRFDPLLGPLVSPAERTPEWVLQAGWRLDGGAWGTLDTLGRYVSPRRASRDNLEWNFNRPYALGGYTTFEATWTRRWGAHRIQAYLRNLGARTYAEPGFGGLDYPGQSRAWGGSYGFLF